MRISRRRSPLHTKAIVVINPNNPTGALYPDELLKKIVDLAREHQLIVFADEIYDKCLYDGTTHTSIASLANDVLFITMNGLSKNYRSCRLPGRLDGRFRGKEICPGLYCRAGYAFTMRLCSNVPGQFAIQTALGGYQSINDLVAPAAGLTRQRDLAHRLLTGILGVTWCESECIALHVSETGSGNLSDRR